MSRYSFVPPGGGANYRWASDHSFTKVSSEDTNGAYALMEDNLEATFSLGLHVHRKYAETFYILGGEVNFYIEGRWMTAIAGATVHIPPRIPHAVKIPNGQTGKMLMICQPAGFDQYLVVLQAMRPEQLADEALQQRLAEEYDIHGLGDVPA